MELSKFGRFIAHRGLHNDSVPENSHRAFERAIDKGLAIELDLRLTKDGKLVVIHDADLMRVCGVEGAVADFTYEQLRAFSLKGTGEKIPLFKDVLKQVNGQVPLLIELKNCNFGQLESRAVHLCRGYKGDFAMQAFDPFTVLWLRLFAKDITRGQLISTHKKRFDLEYISLLISAQPIVWKTLGRPDFIAVDHRSLTPRLIKAARSIGAEVFVWTVRDTAQLAKASHYSNHIIFEKLDDRI